MTNISHELDAILKSGDEALEKLGYKKNSNDPEKAVTIEDLLKTIANLPTEAKPEVWEPGQQAKPKRAEKTHLFPNIDEKKPAPISDQASSPTQASSSTQANSSTQASSSTQANSPTQANSSTQASSSTQANSSTQEQTRAYAVEQVKQHIFQLNKQIQSERSRADYYKDKAERLSHNDIDHHDHDHHFLSYEKVIFFLSGVLIGFIIALALL